MWQYIDSFREKLLEQSSLFFFLAPNVIVSDDDFLVAQDHSRQIWRIL